MPKGFSQNLATKKKAHSIQECFMETPDIAPQMEPYRPEKEVVVIHEGYADDAVFIDTMGDAPKEFGYNKCCNMAIFPDTSVDKLHKFAERIPFGECKFFDDGGVPRYLLSVSARAAARSIGAKPITDEEMGLLLEAWL